MTDDQVERLMKSNLLADGDDGKQLRTQCVGARDIMGYQALWPWQEYCGRDSYIQAENASLSARGFYRLGVSALCGTAKCVQPQLIFTMFNE
jgi:hypothetical protein